MLFMYEVVLTRRSSRELDKIQRGDPKAYVAIETALVGLAENPYPNGCIDLGGRDGYRLRVGSYRVLYRVDKGALLVEVFRVGSRGDVYKG